MLVNKDNFDYALTVLLDADLIAVDTETYWGGNTDWDKRQLIGISTYSEIPGRNAEVGFYFPFRHNHNIDLYGGGENLPLNYLRDLEKALTKPEENTTYLFHNAKFDMQVLARDGIAFEGFFYDTMIMSHFVNENTSNKLEKVAEELLGIVHEESKQIKKLRKTMGWEAIPPIVMEKYAAKDAEVTFKLYEKLWPAFMDEFDSEGGHEGAEAFWRREMDLCRYLSKMETYGIRIDKEKAKQLIVQSQKTLKEIRTELGFDPAKPNQLARKLFLSRPEGLGLIPGPLSKNTSDDFPKGIPHMNEEVLTRYNHPVVDRVLEYRHEQKALSTWYVGFHEKCAKDGRLHPSFNQIGTVTGRFSCSNPNMQQLPRDRENTPVKDLLSATEGYVLWEFDYSQIEYRLSAVYAEEEKILDAYKKGTDFHQLTADLFSISRDSAKTLNFAVLYGAGPKKLAGMLGIKQSEASEYLKEYFSTYSGLADVADRAEKAALTRGWVRIWTGRRRHFRYKNEVHKAFNSIIQGGAGEITKETMLKYWGSPSDSYLVGNVHDSLWFEIPEDSVEKEVDYIKDTMEWPSQKFDLPFPVDAKRLSSL